jgi:hypothetical protein
LKVRDEYVATIVEIIPALKNEGGSMSEERNEPKDAVASDPEDATENGGVRQLHFIYHVVADTNQLIKIEELDETTGATKEVPVPLFVSMGEVDEPESEAPPAYAYPGFPYAVPVPMMWMPPPMASTAPPRPFRMAAFGEEFMSGIPAPKAGALRFVAATKGIPPPKAGPKKFMGAEDESLASKGIPPPKAGPKKFTEAEDASSKGIPPPKAGPKKFVPGGGQEEEK